MAKTLYLNGKPVQLKCACIGCDKDAEHVWGGRPHCADCMPPMYKLGKHADPKPEKK